MKFSFSFVLRQEGLELTLQGKEGRLPHKP